MNPDHPLVSIQIVVHNGQEYIRHCLRAVYAQTHPAIEVIVLDNASTDATIQIIREEFPQARCIEYPQNLGMWPGHEKLLAHSNGVYIVGLSVDVILHPDFVREAVTVAESDPRIGAIQAKTYQYQSPQLIDGSYRESRIIDTCGFALSRGRKVINLGH